jgi:Ni/Fe-hydrogenase subunit HybB-like protein
MATRTESLPLGIDQAPPAAPPVPPERLPYGVGRVTPQWLVLVGIAAAATLFGIFAYSREAMEGLAATGMRSIGTMGGATWGLYIAFVVYFVGVSFAGITMAALIRLFNWDYLRPVARMAELLTVISLLLAAIVIVADLGQPLRGLANLPRYARPESPFFGTFTLVISGYLFASLVYLYLGGRRDAAICARVPGRLQKFHRTWAAGYRDTPAERERHSRTSLWMAIAIVPLLITAHSTLGFVFGLQAGRPAWFSTLQAPGFVVMAGISGVGVLIVIAAILRRTTGNAAELNTRVFRFLGLTMMILTLVYLYFMTIELLTSTYAASEHESRIAKALLTGDFAWMYWLTIAFLIIPVGLIAAQAITARWSVTALVVSGLLVNIAAILKRYLLVVPSQTHGSSLPYTTGSYQPNWIEYGVIFGLFGLGTLMYLVFMKVFPIMEISSPKKGESI